MMTWKSLLACIAWALACLGFPWMIDSTGFSQETTLPKPVQYRRVFVPSENLPLLGSDFVPINIDELERLFESYRELTRPPLDRSTPILSQSLLVASLVETNLVSSASRITIACQSETPRPYTLQPFSLAVRPTTASQQELADGARPGINAESQPFRYDSQGRPTISVQQSTDFWFGWSLSGEPAQDASRLQFKLDVPRCLDSRLLLKLPPMWRVESTASVVRPCEDPVSLLGSAWPDKFDFDNELDSANWWLVELSGSSSVSFDLVQSVDAFHLKFDHLISRGRIDYRLLPSTLEVVSEFQLANSLDSLSDLTIRVDPGVHVSSVALDEEPLEWQPSQLPFCIDVLNADILDDREELTSRRLVIRGLAAWPLIDGQKELPTIQIEKAYSVDGVGSLSIHQDWLVNQVSVESGRIVSRSGTTQLGGLGRCDFEWNGRLPRILLHATPRPRLERTETWTRLSNDNDGLVATSWINVGANANPRSSLRLALSPGWAIESVQSTERRFMTTVHRVPNTDQSEWQIQIAPAVENQVITLEVRCRNNSLTKSDIADSPTLVFDGERPITFKDLKQTDFYWIEPTGRYKVDANAELLQCQIDLSALTESQRQRLPRIGEVWLMKLDGNKIPRLTFRRQPAPFTAQLDTTIEPSLLGVSAHYRLKCVPLAGAVSSVKIDVQHSDDVPIRWRQRRNTAQSDDPWIPVESIHVRRENRKNPANATSSAIAARTVQINLPAAMSEEFELEGFADFPSPHSDAFTIRIPLLSLPEAAQKDATLQVDERLALAQSPGSDPWTPLGYVRFKSDSEAYRFRYDPIQLATVDIQMNQMNHLPNVGLDEVVWQYRRYLDGQSECDVRARLFANEAAAIGFRVPQGWRLRKASLDGRVIDSIEPSHDANQVQIWIPRHVSTLTNAQLSLIFDGPPSTLHHREQIAFPVIEPSCTILNQRYELWLPSALSIQLPSASPQLAFPPLEFSKLLPARWSRSLFPTPMGYSLEHRSKEFGWQSDENEFDTSQLVLAWSTERLSDIQKSPMPLTVIARESKLAEDWIMVFAGFALSLCLAHLRKSHLAITGLILALGIVATNGRLLEALQLVALGWIVCVFLVVINACYRPKERTADRPWLGSGVEQASRSKGSRLLHPRSERLSFSKTRSNLSAIWIGWSIAIPLGSFTSSPAMAQSQLDKVYHVVLPLDANGELTSEVAYASEDFLQELYQHQKSHDLVTQFLSARYELQLGESELRNANSSVRLTLRYEIDVRDLRQPISLPLHAEQAKFVALLVDGSEIPLGSRLRWDERVLQWTPPNRGLTQIELTIEANLSRNTEGQSMIEIDVIPFADARLEIETAEMVDVDCDAMGQILAPTAGNLQAALGPKNKLKVRWRKPEREVRVAAPTAMVESEFALLGEAILARTTIEVSDTSTGTGRFDIECDAAWQPLGRRWGNATLLDSLPASSNTRRRYRLRWEDTENTDRNLRSVVIHWTASNSSATLMNLPEIELPGTRVQESLIRFVRREDSAWQIEGLQSWTKVDLETRFEWLPRARGETASFRKTPNAPSAFLRRTSKVELGSVSIDSQLRFLPNEVYCKSSVTLNPESSYGPDIRLTLPADVIVQSVRADQIEIPFSILRLDDSHIQLQAFLDPDSDALGVIIVESIQAYGDASWMRLPLPKMETYPVTDHRVSATRIVGQTIEWEGIDTQNQKTQSPPVTTRPGRTEQSLEVDAWSTRLELDSKEYQEDAPTQDGSQKISEEVGPRYRVLRARESNPGYVVTQLSRNDERWNFRVHGLVEAGTTPIDGVLMEMPSSIWESLQCSHRTTRFASPEATRLLVYVFSDEPSSNKPFEFELTSSLPPTESNATTELPEVRMLGDFEWQQWLIVPRSIANQEARWNFSGARSVDASTVPDFAMSDLPDLAKEFLVVVPTTDRPNVRLSNVAANPLPISLNLAIHETAITTDPLRNMRSSFFLSPRGQLSIPVRIPPNRKLLAVECNGHRVPMSSIHFETSSESNSQFSIRLFSSSLPQKIALHTSGFSESDAVELESSSFPEIVDATPENSLVIIDSKDGAIGYGTQAIEVDQARQLLANSVVAVVEQASGFIAESSLSERRQWWKDWEDSTSTIWYEASLLQSDDFLSAISGRRHALFERLQLRALSQPPPPAAHPPVRPVAMPFVDTFQANPSTMHVRQYFLIDSEINATSALRIKPTLPPKGSWLDVDVWFGWSLWLVTAVFVIRYTQLRFDAWMVTLKQFFLHRPWWLFVAMGVLVLALAPNSWYGLGFIALSLYFVIRTYWYEVGRVA